MNRTGNRRHAEFAINLHDGVFTDRNDEWANVGSGASRVAIMHKPTQVVYKIAPYSWDSDMQAAEVRRARTLAKIVENNGRVMKLRVPTVSLYWIHGQAVVAMPFVEGETLPYAMGTRAMRGRAELFVLGRFGDMHSDNFRVDNDANVIPIDFGSNRGNRSYCGPDRRLIEGIPWSYVCQVEQQLLG